jgi:hypothetical protein
MMVSRHADERADQRKELEEKDRSSGGQDVEKASLDFVDRSQDDADFGGERSLPPPPQLTEAEEKKLYRKIDIRYVHPSYVLPTCRVLN